MSELNCDGLSLPGFPITGGLCTQLASPPAGGTYCHQDMETWLALGITNFKQAIERGVQHKCLKNAELARVEWENLSWSEQETIPHPRMLPFLEIAERTQSESP